MPSKVFTLVVASVLAALPLPTFAAGTAISAVEAIGLAQARFEGEPIDVERDDAERHEPAGDVYEVKLLTEEGDVIELRFSVADGRYLGAEGDDISRARKPFDAAAGARP